MSKNHGVVLAIVFAPTLAVFSCSANHSSGRPEASDASSVPRLDGPLVLDASCRVVVESPPLVMGAHVPIGSAVSWNSNPPSSGDHFAIWAAYQAYTSPVPRGYYVHDIEHGAVVLLYHCGDAGCPDVIRGLQAASDALPADPMCTARAEGVRVRTVISADPLLDVPVAAVAWGWTYKAECIDLPTLKQFVAEHYGQGPEALCDNGVTAF